MVNVDTNICYKFVKVLDQMRNIDLAWDKSKLVPLELFRMPLLIFTLYRALLYFDKPIFIRY